MKITRIDFTRMSNGAFKITKYPDGWQFRGWDKKFPLMTKPEKIPISYEEVKSNFDLQSALAWCTSHGWVVHSWEEGARAWLGEPIPIRSDIQSYVDLFGARSGADFAFDW